MLFSLLSVYLSTSKCTWFNDSLQNREIYRWIRLAMALPFAPVNQLENLWIQLLENKPEGYFIDTLKKIEDFADYMKNN